MMNWVSDIALEIAYGMVDDIERYAILAIGVWLALWVILRDVLRNRKIRGDWPPAKQLVMEFAHSIRSIAIYSVVGLLISYLWRWGLVPWADVNRSMDGPYWFWGSVLAMIVVHDAYFYWAHKLVHHPKRFRLYHRRHHLSMNPSPFTAYSFDIREAAIMVTFVLLWTLMVPHAPGSIAMFVVISLVKNTLGHSGFELMPATREGKPMFDWLTTTVHHDLHHRRAGYNFGLYFTWWDRWMGTEDPIYHAEFKRVIDQGREIEPESAEPAAA